ncbi:MULTISPECIES: hypothetical protein [unclassified Actinomyces]|uniref:hypothetical protein n=1 Tax=unclassified Actinomyces TaxID=2609248 RepID=UPI0011BEA55E|nr:MULTISPECIES: hypothetical protein [unclassified Actinomyces]
MGNASKMGGEWCLLVLSDLNYPARLPGLYLPMRALLLSCATLTRPTFYASFSDLPGAFAAAAVARLEDVFAAAPPTGAARRADAEELAATFRQLLTRMQPHAEFFLRVLNGPGGPAVETAIIEFLAERLRTSSPAASALAAGPLPLRVSSEAIAAGVTWTMRRWLAEMHGADSAIDIAADSQMLRDLVLHMTAPGLGIPTSPEYPGGTVRKDRP